MTRSVTVSASASLQAKPDAARIQSGVVTEATTATAALAANTKAMTNVIDGLKSLGVEAKDIQTTNFNVNPRYNHNRDGGPPEITGYQVTNEVSVMIRDLAGVGDILDKLINPCAAPTRYWMRLHRGHRKDPKPPAALQLSRMHRKTH